MEIQICTQKIVMQLIERKRFYGNPMGVVSLVRISGNLLYLNNKKLSESSSCNSVYAGSIPTRASNFSTLDSTTPEFSAGQSAA
jgi:hypothetical protein|tara:strand:+ start:574 stop:825 length:252 start_codon:yes stop_codon:yes gene_type:complete